MKRNKKVHQEPEHESPFVILTHLYRDASRAFAQQVGMSLSRIEVLHELMHAGEISQKELGQRLGMEGALLTRFAKQMEAAGLITRRVDPKDNRLTLVTLAQAGHPVLQEMERLGEEFQTRLLEGLSEEERACLVQAMKHIQDNLSRRLEQDE
jgi:DNA-binding MarR family transcriptional regulator